MHVELFDGRVYPAIDVFVEGEPQQKGSKKAYLYPVKGVAQDAHWRSKYRASIVDENKEKAVAWERKIKLVCMEHRPPTPWECAIRLDVTFFMPRPKSVKRKYHTVKPDRDKLLRCVQDALTGLIYRDDSQVTEGQTNKLYGHSVGARIKVLALGDAHQEELYKK